MLVHWIDFKQVLTWCQLTVGMSAICTEKWRRLLVCRKVSNHNTMMWRWPLLFHQPLDMCFVLLLVYSKQHKKKTKGVIGVHRKGPLRHVVLSLGFIREKQRNVSACVRLTPWHTYTPTNLEKFKKKTIW